MTRREEIREWIARRHCDNCMTDEQCSFKRGGGRCPDYYEGTDGELSYLDSQGVVIKVDRECRVCGGSGKFAFVTTSGDPLTYEGDCLACKGTGKGGVGFVAVEPLIGG